MKTARYLGVSFYKGRIQLAEVEHGKKVIITTLAERETTMDFAQAGVNLSATHPQLGTFVAELKELLKQHKLSPQYISFALPPDPVFINIVPMDPSLKGADLTNYLQWEVGQYFPGPASKEFILDSHALPLSAGGAQNTFMVGVRKGMVAFIQKVVAELRLKLNIIDIDQFSTEKTLLINYPEILEHDIALIGLRYGAIDASVIHEGQMSDYRAYNSSDPKKSIHLYLKYLKQRNGSGGPAALLLHGIDVTQDLIVALRNETGIKQTLPLNSLRKLPASEKIYKPFLKESYRFAAAIGLALRSK
ncbi:MAG: pilus assembly protein PilM [Bacteroidota bacterium]